MSIFLSFFELNGTVLMTHRGSVTVCEPEMATQGCIMYGAPVLNSSFARHKGDAPLYCILPLHPSLRNIPVMPLLLFLSH